MRSLLHESRIGQQQLNICVMDGVKGVDFRRGSGTGTGKQIGYGSTGTGRLAEMVDHTRLMHSISSCKLNDEICRWN